MHISNLHLLTIQKLQCIVQNFNIKTSESMLNKKWIRGRKFLNIERCSWTHFIPQYISVRLTGPLYNHNWIKACYAYWNILASYTLHIAIRCNIGGNFRCSLRYEQSWTCVAIVTLDGGRENVELREAKWSEILAYSRKAFKYTGI